jgi:hypothetical protein
MRFSPRRLQRKMGISAVLRRNIDCCASGLADTMILTKMCEIGSEYEWEFLGRFGTRSQEAGVKFSSPWVRFSPGFLLFTEKNTKKRGK